MEQRGAGKAAVHCVIIGFGQEDLQKKRLFDYADIDGPAHEQIVHNINPYLVDAPDVALANRRIPLCRVPPMVFGNMPNDGGHLLLSDVERVELVAIEPEAVTWIHPFLGAEEFINGIARWCLWLKDIPTQELKKMPHVLERIEAVRKHRAASTRAATNKLAATPTLFGEIRQPKSRYILVPRHSSENRTFIPLGYIEANVVVGDSNMCVPDAPPWHFGVMTSTMHMAWVRAVCGRIKSDFRYSAQIVYNNFPWAQDLDEKHRAAIESSAQGVLDARVAHAGATLAQLYNTNTMPPDLSNAHAALDRAVDAAYVADGGAKKYASDAERVAFLFRRYAELTSIV